MKRLCMLAAMALLDGCASSSTQQTPTQARQQSESDKPPVIGMTKEEILSRYGEPKKKTVTDEGEQWLYILNMGEFIGKHMIPFFYSETQLRTATIIFGPDGRVKKFNWDTRNQ